MSTQLSDPTKLPIQQSKLNNILYAECRLLCRIIPLTAEAETGGVFYNGQTSVLFRITLQELDYP